MYCDNIFPDLQATFFPCRPRRRSRKSDVILSTRVTLYRKHIILYNINVSLFYTQRIRMIDHRRRAIPTSAHAHHRPRPSCHRRSITPSAFPCTSTSGRARTPASSPTFHAALYPGLRLYACSRAHHRHTASNTRHRCMRPRTPSRRAESTPAARVDGWLAAFMRPRARN